MKLGDLKLAVLGYPIRHSGSPAIFADLAKKHNISLDYDILEINPENFFQEQHRLQEYDGLNVTSPYKQKILEFVQQKSPEVEELQACNTICNRNGVWSAFNTDVYGFQKSFSQMKSNSKQSILILGSGGAARAVELAFRQMNFENIHFHSRRFPHNLKTIEPNIIVNATIIGMNNQFNDDSLKFFNLPWNTVQIAFDLIYVPQETIFMQIARQQNVAQIQGGMNMLRYQAEKSYEYFTGVCQ